MKKAYLFIIIGVILLILAGVAIAWPNFLGGKFAGNNDPQSSNEPVFCTMEAKMCPDGSYVGRVPPKCEFSPCPGENGWKKMIDKKLGVSFLYPDELTAKFINEHVWPPAIEVSRAKFVCQESEPTSSQAERVSKRLVDDRVYCVWAKTGAAAGSAYTEYKYSFAQGENLFTLSFALRFPNCGNYDEAEKDKCEAEREAFDLDGVIDRIAQTIKFD